MRSATHFLSEGENTFCCFSLHGDNSQSLVTGKSSAFLEKHYCSLACSEDSPAYSSPACYSQDACWTTQQAEKNALFLKWNWEVISLPQSHLPSAGTWPLSILSLSVLSYSPNDTPQLVIQAASSAIWACVFLHLPAAVSLPHSHTFSADALQLTLSDASLQAPSSYMGVFVLPYLAMFWAVVSPALTTWFHADVHRLLYVSIACVCLSKT